MPPLLAFALGLIGAAALVRWCVKEVHRQKVEADAGGGAPPVEPAEPVDRNALPTLKRDPKTGEYRPG